jgi:hypothetical protein
MNETLPPIPLDDLTLDAIEHALGACLTYDGEDGETLDEPRLIGAEYQLATLLDFLSGAVGEDPNGYQLEPGDVRLPGIEGAEVWMDTRPHYSEKDLIAALVAEVRALRAAASSHPTGNQP